MEPFLGRLCLRRVDSLKVLREILGLHVSHDCLLVQCILISIYFQVIDYLWHTFGRWLVYQSTKYSSVLPTLPFSDLAFPFGYHSCNSRRWYMIFENACIFRFIDHKINHVVVIYSCVLQIFFFFDDAS